MPRKAMKPPVQGGVRRQMARSPTVDPNGDTAIIKYNTFSSSITSDANGQAVQRRFYMLGNSSNLVQPTGPQMVSYYSCGKFTPGTRIRWEPSVSFSTSGRVFVGFCDNPEVNNTILGRYDTYVLSPGTTNYTNYADAVKGLGSVISFPVWQETEITFPTKLRRKSFDVNVTYSGGSDTNDRALQTNMWVAFESMPASTACGNFWYHDRVQVEGLTNIVT